MGDDRAIVYEDNGKIVYRASALGGCMLDLSAARLGYDPLPPPEKLLEVYQRGHDAEDEMCEWLGGKFQQPVTNREQEFEVKITDKVVVRCHIDGMVLCPDGPVRVVENKSQSEVEFGKWLPDWSTGFFPHYKWQASVLMLATGMGMVLVRHQRDSDKYYLQSVEVPWYSLTAIRARVLKVEAAARRGELLPADDCNTSYGSPYYYLHAEMERVVLDDPEIDTVAKTYKHAQAEKKRWEGIEKENRRLLDKLDDADKASKQDSYPVITKSGVKLTFYSQANPPSLDKDKLEEKGIDIREFQVQTKGRRLRVTLPEDEKKPDA